MADEHEPGEPSDTEMAELLDRVRSGVSGIRPRPDALSVVRRQVGRRRRRRRIVGSVAAAATAAVVVPALVLAGLRLSDGSPVSPARPGPTAILDGTRPAAFFVEQVGGRARGQEIQYPMSAGTRYYARFLWWPDVDDDAPVLAGAAIEQYDGRPDDACAALVLENETEDPAATASCATTSDGQVVRVIDTTANGLRIDPLSRRGRLEGAAPGDPVRAATVFRDDGWAITVSVCACVAWQGADLPEPPLSVDELGEAAADPDWVPTP